MIPGGSIPKQRWEVCSMKKPWVSLTDVVFHCLSEYILFGLVLVYKFCS